MVGKIFQAKIGTRIFLSSLKSRWKPKRYKGNAKKICKEIIEECWNGRYFQTSAQNFPEFWIRDFAWCTKSLIELGHRDRVHKTLRYALNAFQKAGKITTTIDPKGKVYDFPNYAVDSLPWLIHSIKVSKFDYRSYKGILHKALRHYADKVVDVKTQLVRDDAKFSSMKDYSIRYSSAYDNSVHIMLMQDLMDLRLFNPFYHKKTAKETKTFYAKKFSQEYWSGEYFFDDVRKKNYVAADANVFPIILGIVTDTAKVKSVIKYLQKNKLDSPLPLKYAQKNKEIKFTFHNYFVPGYETDSCWTHMGLLWVKALQVYDKKLANKYKKTYTEMVEKEAAFLEVLGKDGKPFQTLLYSTDRSMLWAANYLTL